MGATFKTLNSEVQENCQSRDYATVMIEVDGSIPYKGDAFEWVPVHLLV